MLVPSRHHSRFPGAMGQERPLEKLAPPPHHSRFPGPMGQTRWCRPIFLPCHGFGPSRPAEMMAQGKPFLGHWHCLWLTPSVRCSQSPAVLPPKTQRGACVHAAHCIRHRSALHSPSQRIAFAIAARCVCPCSALRFLSYRGSGHRTAHSVPIPRLRHHSSVCTVMNWASDFGGAWHGAADFLQLYRKIPQKAVLWQKKWIGWLDL